MRTCQFLKWNRPNELWLKWMILLLLTEPLNYNLQVPKGTCKKKKEKKKKVSGAHEKMLVRTRLFPRLDRDHLVCL